MIIRINYPAGSASVMIAMALACDPELLIADEPTTALDVTVQLKFSNYYAIYKLKRGMSILLITYDFGVVAQNGAASRRHATR